MDDHTYYLLRRIDEDIRRTTLVLEQLHLHVAELPFDRSVEYREMGALQGVSFDIGIVAQHARCGNREGSTLVRLIAVIIGNRYLVLQLKSTYIIGSALRTRDAALIGAEDGIALVDGRTEHRRGQERVRISRPAVVG